MDSERLTPLAKDSFWKWEIVETDPQATAD
jgi:hypothetical protein